MSRIYYITPAQYKTLETLINEEDSEEKLTHAYEIAAQKLYVTKRTVENHVQAIESEVKTTNKYKIAKLFLENRLIPIDKCKEKDRWQKIQTQHRAL